MLSPERLEILQIYWVRLLGQFGVEPVSAYPTLDRLIQAYSEPHRAYHNLEHLNDVLRVIGKLASLAENPDLVFLAGWFHDVVYDPLAKDNEEASAQWAIAELGGLIGDERANVVADLVRATMHDNRTEMNADTAVLLDADLSILGAEPKRYEKYAKAIRQEYSFVLEEDYRIGRTKVLQSFLARERLFQTERMYAVGEELARQNIANEIAVLATPAN